MYVYVYAEWGSINSFVLFIALFRDYASSVMLFGEFPRLF